MSVADYYDAAAANYSSIYQRQALRDTSREYPANYHRLQLLLNSFVENSVKRVVEVGVGEGTPLAALAQAGMEVAGFDISDRITMYWNANDSVCQAITNGAELISQEVLATLMERDQALPLAENELGLALKLVKN